MSRSGSLALGVVLAFADLALAAPVLLRDINEYARPSKRITHGLVAGGKLFLRTETPADRRLIGALTVVDGATGTTEHLDVGVDVIPSFPIVFARFGNRIVFSGETDAHGIEPWISDGTVAGTRELADIEPDGSSSPQAFVSLGDELMFFLANRGDVGAELFATDGTTADLAGDLNLGPDSSTPFPLAAVGGGVVFAADHPTLGREPWLFSVLGFSGVIKNINPTSGSFPNNFLYLPALNKVLFAATQTFDILAGTADRELWISDGTDPGTTLVKDIEPGLLAGGSPRDLRLVNGKGVFRAQTALTGYELWSTDGTGPGTVMLAETLPGPGPGARDDGVVLGGNRLVYPAEFPDAGVEPAVTDGMTVLRLADVLPGPGSGWFETLDPPDRQISAIATTNRVFLPLDDGVHGPELWRTDGTPRGTSLVADLLPGAGSSQPRPLAADGETLYFSANSPGKAGIWTVSGNGTPTLISDLTGVGTEDTRVLRAVTAGDRVYFPAADAEAGAELWSTDGTPAGTNRVADIWPGFASGISPFTLELGAAAGDLFVFGATGPTEGFELYVSDGSAAGTGLLKDINPGSGSSTPTDFTRLGSRVLFAAGNPDVGRELWISDGTAAGTVLLKNIRPGSASSGPRRFGASGSRAFFAANDETGEALWTTDGTADGTVRLVDVALAGPTTAHAPVPFDGGVVFIGKTPDEGEEPWFSDGTPAGTRVIPLVPGPASSAPDQLTAAGSRVFFRVGRQLCVTDGTTANTRVIGEFASSSIIGDLVALGERALFTVIGDDGSVELWTSDGTSLQRFQVMCPAGRACGTSGLFTFADSVFFNHDDGVHGVELWRTDGAAAGTRVVADVAPGTASFTTRATVLSFLGFPGLFGAATNPSWTSLGGKIFFFGCEDAHGCEPWIYDVFGDDLRARIDALIALIDPLKRPKTKAERQALRVQLASVRAARDAVLAYWEAHRASFPTLREALGRVHKAVKKLTRATRKIAGPRRKALAGLATLREMI